MRSDKYLLWLGLLFFFAFTLRFWGIGDNHEFMEDEVLHVPAAGIYISTGHQTPDNWYHPPLKHFLLFVSMKLLGDNPYGWRMRNIIFGTLTVVIMVMLGKEIFSDERTALVAGLFLAVDPLHIVFSRTSFAEIFTSFFFYSGLLALIRHLKGRGGALGISGLFFGLSIASKWYFLPALPVIMFLALYHRAKGRGLDFPVILSAILSLVLIPLSVYILSYFPWFGRGYGIQEFLSLQEDNLRDLRGLVPDSFQFLKKTDMSSPLTWFIAPHIYGYRTLVNASRSSYHVYMSNFPLLTLTFPALLYLFCRVKRERIFPVFLLLSAFCAVYLPLVTAGRPIFLYSLLPLLPAAYLAVACFIVSLTAGLRMGKTVDAWLIVLTIAWGVYLFPFVTGSAVSDLLYRPLVAMGEILPAYLP